MAGEPVIGDGVRPPTPSPATPTPAHHPPAEQLRALTEVLAEGEVVSARVVQALGGDQYQLALRGRTIIAESATPLAQDSVVRIQLVAGGAQPTLRLLDLPAAFDQALTGATPARAQALGLPPTVGVLAAVAAFEEVGAPLDPARLRHAVEHSAPLPPAEAATRLRALALVARADLPATPALIALAGHSVTQSGERALPNPAAAVIALRQAAQPLLTQALTAASAPAGTTALEPDLPTTVTAPAVTTSQSPTADPRTPSSNQPQAANTPSAPTTAASTSAPAATSALAPPLASSAPLANTEGPAPVPGHVRPPVISQAALPAAPLSSASPAPVSPSSATAQSPVMVSPSLPTGQPVPVGVANSSAQAAPPAPLAAGSSVVVVSQSPLPPVIMPRPAVPQSASPAVLLRDLLTEPLPDLATGGVEAVKRALSLAGVRSRPAVGDEPSVAIRSTTLAERVAALPLANQPDSPQVLQPLTEPALRLTRELAVDAVFKPEDLADYDRVLALPVMVHGQPVPARLAVAERHTTGGTATFVRVDTDLSALGEVSVRLSGIEGGSLAITLLASGSGGRALADGLPALVDSLRELGIVAAVRVADPFTDDLVDDHG